MAQRMSMKNLVDTCALFALAEGSLSMRAAHAVASTPEVFVSLASLWEVAGKLSIFPAMCDEDKSWSNPIFSPNFSSS